MLNTTMFMLSKSWLWYKMTYVPHVYVTANACLQKTYSGTNGNAMAGVECPNRTSKPNSSFSLSFKQNLPPLFIQGAPQKPAYILNPLSAAEKQFFNTHNQRDKEKSNSSSFICWMKPNGVKSLKEGDTSSCEGNHVVRACIQLSLSSGLTPSCQKAKKPFFLSPFHYFCFFPSFLLYSSHPSLLLSLPLSL